MFTFGACAPCARSHLHRRLIRINLYLAIWMGLTVCHARTSPPPRQRPANVTSFPNNSRCKRGRSEHRREIPSNTPNPHIRCGGGRHVQRVFYLYSSFLCVCVCVEFAHITQALTHAWRNMPSAVFDDDAVRVLFVCVCANIYYIRGKCGSIVCRRRGDSGGGGGGG